MPLPGPERPSRSMNVKMQNSDLWAPRFGGDDATMSAREVGRLMLDHMGHIVGIAAVVTALAGAYAFLATPIYSADALVRVDAPDANAFGTAAHSEGVVSQLAQPGPETEIAMIQSRAVLEPVVQRYRFDISVIPNSFPVIGWLADHFTFGNAGAKRIQIDSLNVPPALEDQKLELRVLSNDRYELLDPAGRVLLQGTAGKTAEGNGVSMLVSGPVPASGTTYTVVRWNSLNAIQRFQRDLKVAEKGKGTGLISISYKSNDAAKATGIANAVAQGYIAVTTGIRQLSDTKTLEFIRLQLPRLREELKVAEMQLSDYQSSARSLQPNAEAQSYLQGGIEYHRQIATLQMRRTQLLQHLTPTSQDVENLDQQIAQLQTALQKFDARFDHMPESARKGVELTRNAKVAEAIYVAMVKKAEELTVRRAGEFGNVHIVDPAMRPSLPVKPNRMLVISAGAGLGLMSGMLFVLMRRRFLEGVTDPLVVEHRFSLPLLGSVLFSQQQERLNATVPPRSLTHMQDGGLRSTHLPSTTVRVASGDGEHSYASMDEIVVPPSTHAYHLLACAHPHDMSVEALRAIRSALQFDLADAPDKVVILTSPTPSVGKSFVAANLAVLQAETKKRVLLVDADMRRGRLASFFNQTNERGLSELLSDQMPLQAAIRPTAVSGLSLLACGAYPPNPSELLAMPCFGELLEKLNQQFDMVIIDTPPVLAVTDAAIIANRAGNTALVLRTGMQTEEEIQEAVRKLEQADARILGSIFNAIPVRRSTKRSMTYLAAYASR